MRKLLLLSSLFLSIVSAAFAQSHFDNDYSISIYDTGVRTGSFAADIAIQSDIFQFNVVWDSSGNATLTGNRTLFRTDAVVGSHASNYEMRVVQLSPGRAAILVSWTYTDVVGNTTGGTQRVGVVDQSNSNVLSPMTTSTSSSSSTPAGGNRSWSLTLGSGGGQTITRQFPYTYGYMGSNGVYYVVAGTISVTLTLPSDMGGGNQNMD